MKRNEHQHLGGNDDDDNDDDNYDGDVTWVKMYGIGIYKIELMCKWEEKYIRNQTNLHKCENPVEM